ncbi:MAG TPA: hypothetical protein PLQ76_07130, partial [bacterium]|nr:hypothetical protein [bacterium]
TRIEFAYDPRVVEACRIEFETARRNVTAQYKVPEAEDVRKVLYIRPMSEDNGEKTPTQKTRLNTLHDRYKEHLEALYRNDDSFVILKTD